jgi:hypothetical protein
MLQGFALGEWWLRQSSGLAAANTSIEGSSWIVSSAYTTDVWGVGAGYFGGHSEYLVNVAGKDEHNKWIVEGKYVFGTGVTFFGALFGFDLGAEETATQAATGIGNVTDNDGWGVIVGVKMSFRVLMRGHRFDHRWPTIRTSALGQKPTFSDHRPDVRFRGHSRRNLPRLETSADSQKRTLALCYDRHEPEGYLEDIGLKRSDGVKFPWMK